VQKVNGDNNLNMEGVEPHLMQHSLYRLKHAGNKNVHSTSSINTYLPPTTKPELIFEIAVSAALLVLNIAYAFPTVKKDTYL
jgi:hypothetical protein